MISELELDSEGNLKTSPVTDYGTHPVFGSAILLRIEFSANSKQVGGSIWWQSPSQELHGLCTQSVHKVKVVNLGLPLRLKPCAPSPFSPPSPS
jgi:hypothetical protein